MYVHFPRSPVHPLTPDRVHFCPDGPLRGSSRVLPPGGLLLMQNAAFCGDLRLRPHHALSKARLPPSGCIPRNRLCSWAHDRVLHFANCRHSLYTSPTVRTRPPGGGLPASGSHTPFPLGSPAEVRDSWGGAVCDSRTCPGGDAARTGAQAPGVESRQTEPLEGREGTARGALGGAGSAGGRVRVPGRLPASRAGVPQATTQGRPGHLCGALRGGDVGLQGVRERGPGGAERAGCGIRGNGVRVHVWRSRPKASDLPSPEPLPSR